jgi:hypothetical protein
VTSRPGKWLTFFLQCIFIVDADLSMAPAETRPKLRRRQALRRPRPDLMFCPRDKMRDQNFNLFEDEGIFWQDGNRLIVVYNNKFGRIEVWIIYDFKIAV